MKKQVKIEKHVLNVYQENEFMAQFDNIVQTLKHAYKLYVQEPHSSVVVEWVALDEMGNELVFETIMQLINIPLNQLCTFDISGEIVIEDAPFSTVFPEMIKHVNKSLCAPFNTLMISCTIDGDPNSILFVGSYINSLLKQKYIYSE